MSDTFADLELLDQLLDEEGISSQPTVRIPRRPRPDHCALSYQQQRLWFLYELDPASASFHVSGALALRGSLDRDALAWSVDQIMRRHESLRTRFMAIDGTPRQYVAEPDDAPLARIDLSPLAGEALEAEIRDRIAHETSQPFDLCQGPLLRSTLLVCSEQHHVLIVTAHHIVCDGWSIGIFMSELAQLYQNRVQGLAPALAPLPVQYGDYAHWQREHQGREYLEEHLHYWQQQLADLPTLWLPWDHARPDEATPMVGGSVACTVPATVAQALRRLTGEHDATLAMGMMAAFQVLLYRYAGQHDFGVGLAHSNRTSPEMEGLIGFFVNMLVIRADLQGKPSFVDVVTRVRDTVIAAMDHADVPFEMLVDRLSPDRHMNRHPLFQVSFVFQNLPPRAFQIPGLSLERVGEDQTARFDLEIFIVESDGELRINWVYDAGLFERETIEWMADAFLCLLTEAAATPAAAIDDLRLLPQARGLEIMERRERARQVFSGDTCLHAVFARTAARFPNRTGLVDGQRKWRYREIDAAANRMAHLLAAQGVTPGSLVGLYQPRSAEMALSILAILKAGAAYVPIDPMYPPERAQFMIEDSGVSWVIADATLKAQLPSGAHGYRVIELDPAAWQELPATPPEVDVTPDMVAYVIYTSGSTGAPKGCLVTHRNVVRLMRATEAWFGFNEKDVWTLFHSYAFDFSVWEMWGAWFYGGRLLIVPYATSRDTESFYDLLCTQRVTVLNQTPSAFKSLIEVDRTQLRDGQLALRYVIFGGEALDLDSLRPWMERHGDTWPRLVNMYGITETTVHVTYRPIGFVDVLQNRGSVIGEPIPDLVIHILDANQRPIPPGAIGEIYVGGAGVSLGYLNRDETTRQRFVANPFAAGERWYRSGDLGRWLGFHDIEYRGRADQQVKIRGFRIEMDEIRARIQAMPEVRDSLVILDQSSGESRLLAYVIPDRTYLSARERLRRRSELQVGEWQQTFDAMYTQENPTGIEEFNTAGWLQSQTGAQIPDVEMREWLDDTVRALRGLKLDRVLEIGCGTGMLLLGLADASTRYVGVDFSATTVARLREIVGRRGLTQVELHQRPAQDLDFLHGQRFDTIILNSIIQYFPDHDYLLGVLQACAGLLAEGGTIFVGDVRNLALLEHYHAALVWHTAPRDTSRQVAAERIRVAMEHEEELLLDPAFFARLPEQLPGIQAVVASAKPGVHVNELNKYRYDVYLCREQPAAATRAQRQREPAPAVLAALREESVFLDWIRGERSGASVGDVQLTAAASAAAQAVSPLQSSADAVYNQPALAQAIRVLPAEIRVHLGQFLPDYMIPAHIVMVESLPLTIHGKVDLKALPRPLATRALAAERFVAPQPGRESELASVWREVLNVERVSRDDNFFELGGHSLLATQLIARINQRFAISLPLRAVFERPTLVGFAQLITEPESGPASRASDTIPRADRSGPLPLSFAQQRLWFLDRLAPGQSTYNTYQVIDVHGPLDVASLQKALDTVMDRHEVLRTSIDFIEEAPRQIIHAPTSLALRQREASYTPDGQPSESLLQAISEEANQSFTLDQAPLLRATVFSQGPARHTLVLVAHHIVVDGWSLGVLVHELNTCYQAYRRGESPALPTLPVQYADYASWQAQWIRSDAAEAQRAYWLRELALPPPGCTLPHDSHQDNHGAAAGAIISQRLGPALSAALAEYCTRHRTTPFMVLLSALNLLLYRVTGKDDLIIGSPIAQRNRRELEPLIGFFVNTLAFRARPQAEQTFHAFTESVRRTVLDAYEHQNYPFERMVEELLTDRDGTENPLFQIMLVVQNQPMAQLDWDGLACNVLEMPATTAKFDLTLFAGETADGEWALTAEYRVGCYGESTVRAYLEAFRCILTHALSNPDERVGTISLVSSPTRDPAPVEPAALLLDLFAQVVREHASAIAVEDDERSLTYGDLDRVSDGIAHALVAAGVRPEKPVGVLMEPRVEVITLFLGILKAGGVYLPLDPRHPVQRLQAIAADARPVLVVTADSDEDPVSSPAHSIGVPVWTLHDLRRHVEVVGSARFASAFTPAQLAYIIYTSGSTGKPKGTTVEHRGMANLALTEMRHYGTRHGDRVLLAANLTFDASVSEIINVLASGATLVILPRDRMMPDDSLVEELRAKAITWWTIRPSFVSLLRDRHLPSLRTLILAGERLETEVARPWLRPGRTVFNAYGPTETTVCASCDPIVSENDPPAIGRPLDNVRMYVLDSCLNPLPDGIVGEIYIGGTGVSRGYLHQPALTSERFLPDPFSPVRGARMYRTGDLGKRLVDGRLICLGRTDFQIKLRGYRIDPGEIEACLRQIPGFDDAVVTCQRNPDKGDFLVAHVVTELATDEAESRAQAHLRQHLAEYTIPRYVVAIPRLPLGANGKLDRRGLPAPDEGRARTGPSGNLHVPRTTREWKLCQIFERVLERHPIDVDRSFFELGGHSFLALRLISEIAREFGTNIPVSRVFTHPTIQALATVLDDSDPFSAQSGLVALRTEGAREPLYLVHQAGGYIYSYFALTRHLEHDRPIYALQPPGLSGEQAPLASIPALARYHLRAIRDRQPHGPYHLAGHSLGGIIAYEMAQALHEAGESVAYLGLIDSHLPVPSHAEDTETALDSRGAFQFMLEQIEGLFGQRLDVTLTPDQDPADWITSTGRALARARVADEATALRYVAGLHRVFLASVSAYQAYRAQPYPGDVYVYVTQSLADTLNTEPMLAWDRWITGSLHQHIIPGAHLDLLQEPNVTTLGAWMTEHLGHASQREGGRS